MHKLGEVLPFFFLPVIMAGFYYGHLGFTLPAEASVRLRSLLSIWSCRFGYFIMQGYSKLYRQNCTVKYWHGI